MDAEAGVDIAPKPTLKDHLAQLPTKEKVAILGDTAKTCISVAKEKGAYTGNAGLEEISEKALNRQGDLGDAQSDDIKVTIEALRAVKKDDGTVDDGEQMILDELTPHVKVKGEINGEAKEVSLKEWEEYLATVADDAEKKRLDDNASYSIPEARTPEKTPEVVVDGTINAAIGTLKQRIKDNAEGEDVGRDERMLAALYVISKAKGEWGILLKKGALVRLNQGEFGVDGVKEALDQLGVKNVDELAGLADDLGTLMMKSGRYTEAQAKGYVEEVKKYGLTMNSLRDLAKALPNIEQLVLGKSFNELDLSPEEKALVEKYFPKDKKGHGNLWTILLVLAYTMGKEMTPVGEKQ